MIRSVITYKSIYASFVRKGWGAIFQFKFIYFKSGNTYVILFWQNPVILSPRNVINRFMFEQVWDLLEMYFQNKGNTLEIVWKYLTKFCHKEEPTVAGKRVRICLLLKFVKLISLLMGQQYRKCQDCSWKCVWESVNINSSLFPRIEYFMHQYSTKTSELNALQLKPYNHAVRLKCRQQTTRWYSLCWKKIIIFSDETHFYLAC